MSRKCSDCEFAIKCTTVKMQYGGERNTTGYACLHRRAGKLAHKQFKGKTRPRLCPLKYNKV